MTKQNLLIVDADPESLRVLEVSLRKAGYSVTTAVNGVDALEKVRQDAPDLIISNTVMDRMDGFEFCRALKEEPEWAGIPFIFLTAHKAIEDKIKGLELGVEDYLTKPIFVREILTRVNMLIQRRERERLERRGTKTKFAGRLMDMGVVDIIQTIDISRKTGVIHMNSGRDSGVIYFRDGKVIDAETAVRRGAEAVYRFLFWSDGTFEIDFRPVQREVRIELSTQGLLMEGMRRLDEWSHLMEDLPPLDTVFDVHPELLKEHLHQIPDEVNEVLRNINGRNTIMDIIDSGTKGDLETLGIISRLYRDNLITVARGTPPDCVPRVRDIFLDSDHESATSFNKEGEKPLSSSFRKSSLFLEDQEAALPFNIDREADAMDQFVGDGVISEPPPSNRITRDIADGDERSETDDSKTPDSAAMDIYSRKSRTSMSASFALRRRRRRSERRNVRRATAPIEVPRSASVEAADEASGTKAEASSGAGVRGITPVQHGLSDTSPGYIPKQSDTASSEDEPFDFSSTAPGVAASPVISSGEEAGASQVEKSLSESVQTESSDEAALEKEPSGETPLPPAVSADAGDVEPTPVTDSVTDEAAEQEPPEDVEETQTPQAPFKPSHDFFSVPDDADRPPAPAESTAETADAHEDSGSGVPKIIVDDERMAGQSVEFNSTEWKRQETEQTEQTDEASSADVIRAESDLDYLEEYAADDDGSRARLLALVLLVMIGIGFAGYSAYYYFVVRPREQMLEAISGADEEVVQAPVLVKTEPGKKNAKEAAATESVAEEPEQEQAEEAVQTEGSQSSASTEETEEEEVYVDESVSEVVTGTIPPPDPETQKQYEQLMRMAEKAGGKKKEKLYRDAISAYAYGHEAMAQLAVLLMESSQTRPEALAMAQKAVSIDPQNSLGWLVAGYVLQLEGDIDASDAAYKKCIAITPEDRYVRECRLMMRSR